LEAEADVMRGSRPALAPASQSCQPPGLCVLVVEDDEADACLISRALWRQPTVGAVVRAPDGVEALRMVELGEVEPDLAFIDLHMPWENGFDILAAFAGRAGRAFPMVVLTSSSAPADALRSRLGGALQVINKPDTLEAMEVALAAAIDAICPLGRLPQIDSPATAAAAARRIASFPGRRASAVGATSTRERPMHWR
jgi:CheY-like chemotaxis protein